MMHNPTSSDKPVAAAAAPHGHGNNHHNKKNPASLPEHGTTGIDTDLSSHVEVYAAEDDVILTIPRADIIAMPRTKHRNDAAKKIFACPHFDASHPETSCPQGARCKHVHALLTHATKHEVHVNYAWRCLDECHLERFPEGEIFKVAPPNEVVPSDEIPSHLVLKTRALESNRRVISHCAHYYFNRTCNRGAQCFFIHAVSLAPKKDATKNGEPRRTWGRTQQPRDQRGASPSGSNKVAPAPAAVSAPVVVNKPMPLSATAAATPASGRSYLDTAAATPQSSSMSLPASRKGSHLAAAFGAVFPQPLPLSQQQQHQNCGSDSGNVSRVTPCMLSSGMQTPTPVHTARMLLPSSPNCDIVSSSSNQQQLRHGITRSGDIHTLSATPTERGDDEGDSSSSLADEDGSRIFPVPLMPFANGSSGSVARLGGSSGGCKRKLHNPYSWTRTTVIVA